MTKELSIASLTVAYNGAHVLERHLEALKGQTRKLDEIIVINNASTDESLHLLDARFSEVTVLNLPDNGGVGGGLSAGLEYASLTKKYDWVWIFDQDSVPAANALELLLDGLRHLNGSAEGIAVLAPICVHSDTGMTYPGLTWRNGWHFIDLNELKGPVVFVDSVISSGTLLRREAVERIGLPRKDFFMDFVDHEYCLRLRRGGYHIAIVTASQLGHEIGGARRIHLFGLSKKWADHAPWREYYMARNEIFTIWNYYPNWRSKCSTLGRLLHHAFNIFLFGREKVVCLKMIARGIQDGWAGKLGIRDFGSDEPPGGIRSDAAQNYRRIVKQ